MSDVTLKGLALPAGIVLLWSAASVLGLLNGPMAVSPVEVLRVPFLVETWQAWPEFAGPRGYAGDTSYRGAWAGSFCCKAPSTSRRCAA